MGVRRQTPAALALLGLLAAAAPEPPAAAQAARAFVQHDYQRARTIWLRLAHGGDADAAFRLGLLAEGGWGEPQDATVAYHWFRVAAWSGDPQAEFNVAVMKDSGRGTTHDPAGAAQWYARAAAHGNRRAQYNLGLLYKSGDGVPRNQAVARAWFRQAAKGGLPAASEKLEAAQRTPSDAHLSRSTVLRAAVPIVPLAAPLVPLTRDSMAEFVWNAPSQPVPVRFFLQVVSHDASGTHEVYAAYTDVTAALVRLGDRAHRFSWRVFTASPESRSYVVTAWTQFLAAAVK